MTVGVIVLVTLAPNGGGELSSVDANLKLLANEGWSINPRFGAGRAAANEPMLYFAEPYQSIGAFGLLEAPDLRAIEDGIARLQASSWNRAFERTQWLVGQRDQAPSLSKEAREADLGFLALWDWNDAWHKATPDERTSYDAECDVAFDFDTAIGCDIFGRFDMGGYSGWDHAALWEVPNLAALTKAMDAHEAQRDFMYTTSSHFIGRPVTLRELGAIVA